MSGESWARRRVAQEMVEFEDGWGLTWDEEHIREWIEERQHQLPEALATSRWWWKRSRQARVARTYVDGLLSTPVHPIALLEWELGYERRSRGESQDTGSDPPIIAT